jgi:nucleoside phosphorylase
MANHQTTSIGNITAGAVSTGNESPAFGILAGSSPGSATDSTNQPRHSKVLLVVAADVELTAMAKAVKDINGASLTRTFTAHHTVYDLGRLSQTAVLLAQVGQGATTPDSAGASAPELIEALRPDFLILVGICYGMREDDPKQPQRLGDVVIANQLVLAAHKKVASRTITRGGSVHPSPALLDRFRSARDDWVSSAKVHIGPMVSESVLVDSARYRNEVRRNHPEAIGGEMEGAAIYAAAIRSKVDWCVVKGICDWGFDKNDRYQQLAADNASSLVAHMIRIGGLDARTTVA